jgi:hypothetical protein
MSDGRVARELFQSALVEDVGDMTHAALEVEFLTVRTHDSSGFLPPVLQGLDSKVCKPGGLRMRNDCEDTALFVQFIPGNHLSL